MTFGELMVSVLAAFYADFAVIAFGGLALGGALGWWLRSSWQEHRRVNQQVNDAHVLDPWKPVFKSFKPGVAKVDAE